MTVPAVTLIVSSRLLLGQLHALLETLDRLSLVWGAVVAPSPQAHGNTGGFGEGGAASPTMNVGYSSRISERG